MDEVILLLARKGALGTAVRITTSELGHLLGMSQQNASVRIRSLDRQGLVERSSSGFRLTRKAGHALLSEFSLLKKIFEGGPIIFHGKVVRGFKQGKFYLSLPGYRKAIEERLGFTPYPGTLNIEVFPEDLELRLELRTRKPIEIPGFSYKGKVYGPIEAYRCRISGIEGAAIFPRRSQHGLSVVELIAPTCLSKELGLRAGSKVEVEVLPPT